MNLIQTLEKNYYYAIVKKCSESNCKLGLKNLSNFIILKGEKLTTNQKICDCIIYLQEKCVYVVLVELKSRTLHATEIIDKLTNGLIISQEIIKGVGLNISQIKFIPLLLSLSKNTSEYRVLTSKRIDFQGKKYKILLKKCGIILSEVLQNFFP